MKFLKILLVAVFLIPLTFIMVLPYKIGNHYSAERITYALGLSTFIFLSSFISPFIVEKIRIWMENRKLKREES